MEALPCVYGPRPWLVAADEPETAAYFREHGRAEVFQPGTVLPFGREDVIYFIEHGLIATVPTRDGSLTRIAGLFGAETTLGLVRVLRGGYRKMRLYATALSKISARVASIGDFLNWFSRLDAEVRIRILQNCISKTECHLEGVFVNDLQPVNMRLLWIFEILFQAANAPLAPGFVPLPWPITISSVAMIIHTTREMASRGISEWCRAGVMKRDGRRLLVDRERVRTAIFESV